MQEKLCAVFLLLFLGTLLAPATRAKKPLRKLGAFRITYYYMAEEKAFAPPEKNQALPVFAPACKKILSTTSLDFLIKLSLEGTGKLKDGRIINVASRCSCAPAGFKGGRFCFEVMDKRKFPWGRGGYFNRKHAPLIPFKTVAVDPKIIPLGSWLFIPTLKGKKNPQGRRISGCVQAMDTGSMVKGKHLDMFMGYSHWALKFQRKYRLKKVRVRRAPWCEKLMRKKRGAGKYSKRLN